MAIAGVISIVVAAVGAAYSAYSASEAQAQANRYNAKLAKNQAINAANAAQVEIANRREHYNRQMAAQRAALGASGVDPSEGTPLLVQIDSAEQAALDLSRVRYQGEVRSTAYQSEANLQKFYARANLRQGYITAGASLMSGAAKATGAYYGGTTSTAAADNTTFGRG